MKLKVNSYRMVYESIDPLKYEKLSREVIHFSFRLGGFRLDKTDMISKYLKVKISSCSCRTEAQKKLLCL